MVFIIKKLRYYLGLNFVFITSLFLISLRSILYHSGTLGHNWDWIIPQLRTNFEQGYLLSDYLWDPMTFGGYSFFSALQLPSRIFIKIISAAVLFTPLNGDLISKLLPYLAILISSFSMFLLLWSTIKPKYEYQIVPILSGSILYAYSPFMFNELIGGAATQYISYGFIPLLLFKFRAIVCNQDYGMKSIIIFSIIISIICISAQNLFFSIFLIIAYYFNIRSSTSIAFLKGTLKFFLIFSLLNSYWIINIFNVMNANYLESSLQTYTAFLDENYLIYAYKLFYLYGYAINRDFFYFSKLLPPFVMWMLGSCLCVSTFWGLCFAKSDKDTVNSSDIYFWIIVLLIFLFLATGLRPFLSNVLLSMYAHLPLLALFRSIQHYITVITLSFSIIFTISLNRILVRTKLSIYNNYIYYILIIVITLFLSPWLSGDLGYSDLRLYGGGNYVSNYNVPPPYAKLTNNLSSDSHDYRVLFMPPSGSPFFEKTLYQDESQGGDPLIIFSPKPTLTDDVGGSQNNRDFLTICEIYFYRLDADQRNRFFASLMKIMSVKKIVLRKDVIPNFGYLQLNWNVNFLEKFLDDIDYINKSLDSSYINVYELSNRSFLTHIYAANLLFLATNTEHALDIIASSNFSADNSIILIKNMLTTKQLLTLDGLTNYEKSDISTYEMNRSLNLFDVTGDYRQDIKPIAFYSKINSSSYNDTESYNFIDHGNSNYANLVTSRINPTKYITHVNASNPFFLVFSESYHPDWKIYMSSSDNSGTFGAYANDNMINNHLLILLRDIFYLIEKPIDEENHFIVNGYANCWYINKTGTYDLTIYFLPQSTLYLLYLISTITLIICVVYIFYYSMKQYITSF